MTLFTRLLVVALAASWLPPVIAAEEPQLNERREGIWGAVVDEQGNGVPDISIALAQNLPGYEPQIVKSGKDGKFVFPRIEYFEDGYKIGIQSDEYFVSLYHIKSRRPNREIWQDDSGPLPPNAQDRIPVLRHRGPGANATVVFTIAKIAEYKGPMAAPSAAAAQAPGQPKRELTLEEQAEEAAALGDHRAAADLWQKAVDAKPEDAALRWSLAQSLARAGDAGAALREAQGVLKADPVRKGVRIEMARWMEGRGQLPAAVPLLEKERELDPQNPVVAKLLVGAYGESGMKEQAGAELARWIELAPNDPEALLALADQKASAGDFAGAEALFQKLAAADPGNADRMYYNAGLSIINKAGITDEDRRRAITAFRKAIEVNPKFGKAHYQLAYAMIGTGDYAGARQHLKEFLDLEPNDPAAPEVREMLKALPAK